MAIEASDIQGYRKEFNVMVVGREASPARAVGDLLKALGYEDIQSLPTFEGALARAREIPPHVVVVDAGNLLDGLVEEFLVRIRALSPEILTILMVPEPAWLGALALVSRGLAYDCQLSPLASTLELLQKVDRAIARLYFQFESEQLRERYEAGESALAPAVRAGSATRNGNLDRLASLVTKVIAATDTDDGLRAYVDALSAIGGGVPVLYFKYLPLHCSFLFSHAAHAPEQNLRGVGLDLRKEGAFESTDEFFSRPIDSTLLNEMVREIFKRTTFAAQAHVVGGEPFGLAVVLDQDASFFEVGPDAAILGEVFRAALHRNILLKEMHGLEKSDPVTGFLNRRHFDQALSHEISRSRRLLFPVALVVFQIDGWAKIAADIGAAKADALLRACAQQLRKTTRVNDIFGRIDTSTFALIMPHTSQMWAAVKAERMRRMIELTRFPVLEGTSVTGITMSGGVSEYPSLAGDADALLASADDALSELRKDGGNRVCLPEPAARFEPDFVPRKIPSSRPPAMKDESASEGNG